MVGREQRDPFSFLLNERDYNEEGEDLLAWQREVGGLLAWMGGGLGGEFGVVMGFQGALLNDGDSLEGILVLIRISWILCPV